jgi:hypothetical protein
VGEKGGGRRKKGKEGEKRKEKRKKRKRKRKKKKKERETERDVGGIRGGGRRTRRAASVGSDSHAERGKGEHKDGD